MFSFALTAQPPDALLPGLPLLVQNMLEIREAREADVHQIRDLFVRVYGQAYPFPAFYETHWLKKSIYSDDTLMLVALDEGQLVGTASVHLTAGDVNDLIGEMGRMVTDPGKRASGVATQLLTSSLERIREHVHFAVGEARTAHLGSQKICQALGFSPVGFEPLKYRFERRESVVPCAMLCGPATELRRNNPRVIPEIALLAQTVLHWMGLPMDVIVEEESEGYPTTESFSIERLEQKGVTPLLRIERGRLRQREVFGNLCLDYGFFRIAANNSHYLVARADQAVLGAVGFTHDPIDQKVRILELIEFDDAVKGYLLSAVDQLAREEFGALYQEVDVSAYSPKIQRTLERLGFFPVAYCPSMVFENVERLDVVRMAKLNMPYQLGAMDLLERPARVREIVERGLENRLHGMEINEGTRRARLFDGLPDGEVYHLGRIGELLEKPSGTVLVREGELADGLFVMVSGTAEVRSEGQVLGQIGPGEVFGEMGLLEQTRRSADVVLTGDSKLIQFEMNKLLRLVESRPRLGTIVMRNLARGLSEKLRRS